MLRFSIASMLVAATAFAADKVDAPQQFKYQVTGLFMPDREEDLREVVSKIPNVKLASIDYKNAEATFEFIPKVAFPTAKPNEVMQRLDQQIKMISHSTFGLKPPRTNSAEKLKWIEIKVVGLDCKACSLAAYEAVAKLDGVEQATASFKDGRVNALIDPEKTNRETLEAALKKKNIQLLGQ